MLIGKLSRTFSGSARLEHGRLTSLINSMADGVIAVDRQIRIVLYNGAALNILDRNDSMEGKSLGEVLQPIDGNDQPVDIVELVGDTKRPITNRDLRLKYNDGSIINLYLSLAPVRLGYGAVGERGYVILLRDITREKSLEEERDEFISVVSHELRTPIAIAEGNISNAQFITSKTSGNDQIKQALQNAHDQVMFLADMVNDLSTLARAERGTLTLDIQTIDIPSLIQELVNSYEPEAAGKDLKLHVDMGPKVHQLNSSKLYVREILQNFITNALKYTEQGSIQLKVRRSSGGVQFTVTDTGIGISHSDQRRVFEKFFRSEDYRTRKTNGTGLGLYVTAKLARLLKANITLKSRLNHGSSFIIAIPNLK